MFQPTSLPNSPRLNNNDNIVVRDQDDQKESHKDQQRHATRQTRGRHYVGPTTSSYHIRLRRLLSVNISTELAARYLGLSTIRLHRSVVIVIIYLEIGEYPIEYGI